MSVTVSQVGFLIAFFFLAAVGGRLLVEATFNQSRRLRVAAAIGVAACIAAVATMVA